MVKGGVPLWKSQGIVILISLWAGFEFLYAPQVSRWNTAAIFPSIPVGIRLTVGELIVSLFVVIIGGYIVTRRIAQTGRIRLAPRPRYASMVGVFLLSLAISMSIGVLLGSPKFFHELRAFAIPGSLFFIFLNLKLEVVEEKVKNVFYLVGITSLLIGPFVVLFPDLIGNVIKFPIKGYWVALYASVFSTSICTASILWKGWRWKPSLVLALAVVVYAMFLTNKPVVFTFFVAQAAIFFVAFRARDSQVIRRARRLAIAIPVILVGAFLATPPSVKSKLVATFARRYLKVWSVKSVDELRKSFSKIGTGSHDLSAGRFDIWQGYFTDALSGLGLAPKGFGGLATVQTGLHGFEKGYPAHSTIAYLSFHGGYIPAIAYILIIALFLYEGFWYLPRARAGTLRFHKSEYVAIFGFVVALIAVGLVGGPLGDYRLAWFFWFLVALLVKQWTLLTRP